MRGATYSLLLHHSGTQWEWRFQLGWWRAVAEASSPPGDSVRKSIGAPTHV